MVGPFDRALGPEHVEGLPGKVISFYIAPLPACRQAGTPLASLPAAGEAGLAGHVPVTRRLKINRIIRTDPSCFRSEVKGTKKAQEIEEKSECPLSPKPERDLNNEWGDVNLSSLGPPICPASKAGACLL